MIRWMSQGRWIGTPERPLVMGIVNATPDSFSDGGRFNSLISLLTHAESLVADGADLLDIGGESSRPGARPISLAEELDRVIPLVEQLSGRVDVPLSVDTVKPEVAQVALDAGAADCAIPRCYGWSRPPMPASSSCICKEFPKRCNMLRLIKTSWAMFMIISRLGSNSPKQPESLGSESPSTRVSGLASRSSITSICSAS